MTTMSEAVSKVSRLLGITKRSQQPTGHDAADLLAYLQSTIDNLQLLRNGPWCDVRLTSATAVTAKDGHRIDKQGYAATVSLPATYVDDCGCTHLTEDLSRVHVIGTGIFVYSSSLATWNKTDGLAATDTFPFGSEDLDGIVAMAAVEAAPEYADQPLSPIIMERARLAKNSLRGRFWREAYVRGWDDCCDTLAATTTSTPETPVDPPTPGATVFGSGVWNDTPAWDDTHIWKDAA